MFVIMLFTSRGSFASHFNSTTHHLFGTTGDTYARHHRGRAPRPATPPRSTSGFSPFFGQSMLLVPLLCFWILYPNWGATLYGEVRGASDFRGVLRGMMSGLWVTVDHRRSCSSSSRADLRLAVLQRVQRDVLGHRDVADPGLGASRRC